MGLVGIFSVNKLIEYISPGVLPQYDRDVSSMVSLNIDDCYTVRYYSGSDYFNNNILCVERFYFLTTLGDLEKFAITYDSCLNSWHYHSGQLTLHRDIIQYYDSLWDSLLIKHIIK